MKQDAHLRFIGKVKKIDGEISLIEIFPEYRSGLDRISDFSHIIVLYWLHLRDKKSERQVLKVTPRKHPGAPEIGVFSSRSPSRPNPMGLCVCELMGVKGHVLKVKKLDATEGSPIVDIKPYIPRADSAPGARVPDWTHDGPRT